MSEIKLISWNINGIRTRAKNKELDPIFDANPDIILFQETKAKYDQLDANLKNIEEYSSYFSPGESARSGGIATFSKIKPILAKKFFDITDSSLKTKVLNFNFDNFKLIHIYAPSGARTKANKDAKLEFFEKLLNFAKKHKEDKVIIVGDFNIAHTEKDISNPEKATNTITFSDEEREIIDKLEKFGFVDSFRLIHPDEVAFSSWKSQKAKESGEGSRLDYIFVSKSLKEAVKDSKILSNIEGSKHSPIELILEIK